MSRLRRRPGPATESRRNGPVGEQPWWDAADQAALQALEVPRQVFGRGWHDVAMLNNVEPLDPHGPGSAGQSLRDARRRRSLTALDGGRAWRRREGKLLAVLRVERFADADGESAGTHRRLWQAHGAACLVETWRANWNEREVAPGWIEARPIEPEARPDPLHASNAAGPQGAPAAIDWLQVEDHTGGPEVVVFYQHLSIWQGRALGTLTVRHDLGLDVDREVAAAAAAIHALLRDLPEGLPLGDRSR